jgi:hypothetical protein
VKYNLGDIVVMKKNHPCGNNKFEIVRVGADIKIRCVNCSRVIMLSRIDFNKGIRKVIGNYEEEK